MTFDILIIVSLLHLQGQAARKRNAEIKLLVIFCYAFILLAISQITLTFSLRNRQNFRTRLMAYFLCELVGVAFGNNCERSFERFSGEAFIIFSFILLGLYPVVKLVYVVNVKELKNSCRRKNEL